MKKVIIVLIVLILVVLCIFLLTAKPSLKPEKGTYPAGCTEVRAKVKNVMPGKYSTGEAYVLEKLEGGIWLTVKSNAFFTDIGYEVGVRSEFVFDLTKYSDGLTEGQYRILKTFYTKNGEAKELSFEFTVK